MPFNLLIGLAITAQVLGRQIGRLRNPLFQCVVLAFFATVVPARPTDGAGLSVQEEHGRQIYRSGTSPAGSQIKAVLGNGQTTMPATLFPCVRCHGENGRGRSEGGVTASEITWHALTKPYGLIRSDRRSRPPYVQDSLVVRAFSMGLDSGGKTLNSTMPRFRMSIADAKNLVAYLKVLGRTAEAGVTPETVSVGLILPPSDARGSSGDRIGKILDRYFTALNKKGGVYGRQVKLSTFVLPSAANETGPLLRAFLNQKQPLAFVAPYFVGRGQTIAGVLQEQNVPASGPLSLRFPGSAVSGGPLFYILPDLAGQGRVLASFRTQKLSGEYGETVVVHAAGELWRGLADAVTEELRQEGAEAPHQILLSADKVPETLLSQLTTINPRVIFLLAPGETGRRFLRALSGSGLSPIFLSPGLLARSLYSRAPLPTGSRLFLSWPVVPADQSPEGLSILDALISGGSENRQYSDDQLSVAASASVLVEGLRLSGRELSRRKLIASLEKLYKFPTGFVRPLTFGPNRRLGSAGAYVLEFDIKSGKALSRRWMELD